jgi:hypothetical protein
VEHLDDLEQLMSEPPHGHNHGRKRGMDGSWQTLETDPRDIPSTKHYVRSSRLHSPRAPGRPGDPDSAAAQRMRRLRANKPDT